MTAEVDIDGRRHPVLESSVEVEVENLAGAVATIRRGVRTAAASGHQLVRVWPGAHLSEDVPTDERGEPLNLFVNRQGGASSEAGFHNWLASFLGWQLPQVARYDNPDVQLYVQEPLALSYIDQKHGWGGTVPQVPTKYRIVDPLVQAVSFVLDLDAMRRSRSRRELDERVRQLVLDLERVKGALEAAARSQGGRVRFPLMPRLAAQSAGTMLDGVETDDEPVLEVLHDNSWLPLGDRVELLRQRRSERALATALEIRTGADQAGEQLRAAEAALAEVAARLQAAQDASSMLELQVGALRRRLDVTSEERRRYGEILTLRSLGAQIAESSLVEGDCPTCHQSLDEVEALEGTALSVDDTKTVLDNERLTILGLLQQAEAGAQANAARESALAFEASSLRAQIRAIKTDLVSPDDQPSVAALQAAVQDENTLSNLQRLTELTAVDLRRYRELRTALIQAATERLGTAATATTPEDSGKLSEWTSFLRELLFDFSFTSADPGEIYLDERFRPVVDGYDISFQGSASDGIRLRWAYMLSLLAVGVARGQHPGFLIMDEPGQQGVEPVSLRRLYERCASAAQSGQLFLTTSEAPAQLETWLAGGADYLLLDLGEAPLLRPYG